MHYGPPEILHTFKYTKFDEELMKMVYPILIIFKTFTLVVLASETIKPRIIANTIDIKETIIVNLSPPSKNSMFEIPILLVGEIIYHPH